MKRVIKSGFIFLALSISIYAGEVNLRSVVQNKALSRSLSKIELLQSKIRETEMNIEKYDKNIDEYLKYLKNLEDFNREIKKGIESYVMLMDIAANTNDPAKLKLIEDVRRTNQIVSLNDIKRDVKSKITEVEEKIKKVEKDKRLIPLLKQIREHYKTELSILEKSKTTMKGEKQ